MSKQKRQDCKFKDAKNRQNLNGIMVQRSLKKSVQWMSKRVLSLIFYRVFFFFAVFFLDSFFPLSLGLFDFLRGTPALRLRAWFDFGLYPLFLLTSWWPSANSSTPQTTFIHKWAHRCMSSHLTNTYIYLSKILVLYRYERIYLRPEVKEKRKRTTFFIYFQINELFYWLLHIFRCYKNSWK